MQHPNNLQFFQPLLPDFLHNFAIPESFVKHIEECLGDQDEKAELKDRNGRSWCIKVISKNNRKYFKEGWEAFCKDNDLHIGDFLVFRYQGNLRFEVLIFDSTSCEREIRPLRDPQLQSVDEAHKNDQVMPDIREEGDELHCSQDHEEVSSLKDDDINDNNPYMQWYRSITRLITNPHFNETQADCESQDRYYPTPADYSLLTQACVFNYNHASSLLANVPDDASMAHVQMLYEMQKKSLKSLENTRQGHLIHLESEDEDEDEDEEEEEEEEKSLENTRQAHVINLESEDEDEYEESSHHNEIPRYFRHLERRAAPSQDEDTSEDLTSQRRTKRCRLFQRN